MVFVYDELLRQRVSSRGDWGDVTLDLDEAFGVADKKILEAARQRLAHAGITGGRAHDTLANLEWQWHQLKWRQGQHIG